MSADLLLIIVMDVKTTSFHYHNETWRRCFCARKESITDGAAFKSGLLDGGIIITKQYAELIEHVVTTSNHM